MDYYVMGDNHKHHDDKSHKRERTRVLSYGDTKSEENVFYIHSSSPRRFNKRDKVFAWICLFLSYIFCCTMPIEDFPILGFLLVVALFSITTFYLKKHDAVFKPIPIAAAVSAIVLSFSLIFTGNSFLWLFAYAYSLIVYCYFVFSASGNRARHGFTNYLPADFIEALFIAPFYNFTKLFDALLIDTSQRKRKKIVKFITHVFVALVPICAVFILLSYDWKAINEYGAIPGLVALDIIYRVLSIGFAVPIAMYIFSIYSLSLERKRRRSVVKSWLNTTAEEMRIIPPNGIFYVALFILLAYAVYVIINWQSIFAGFTNYLPGDDTVSELARSGFFEAAAISAVNIIVILIMVLFVKRYTSDKFTRALKPLTLIYCFYSLFLIAMSTFKVIRCVNELGLTRNRVYGLCALAVLAVTFLIIIARQFIRKVKVLSTALVVAVLLFGVLVFVNVDSQVAKYNVDGYISGKYETIDVSNILLLGDDAVPDTVRLYDFLGEKVKSGTADYKQKYAYAFLKQGLAEKKENYEEAKFDIFAYTVPRIRAVRSLEGIKL